MIRTLVFTETHIPIDSGEVPVGFSGDLEIRIQAQHKGSQAFQKASEGSENLHFITSAIFVKPIFVIVLAQIAEKLKAIFVKTLEFQPSVKF